MATKRFTVDAVFRGINKISKPARSMGRSISKFVKKSNRQIAKLGRNFKKLGSLMGKAVIGGAAVAAAAMGAAVLKTAELGDEAAKTGRRLGITAEALQELRFAADRQGVSASVLSSSFTALQKRVGELKAGTGSLFAFLKKTGDKAFIKQISLAKNTGEAFELITKKVATIEDPMKKAAFASAAFSRAGVDMLKFMEAGTEGIAKLRAEARKYGAVISNEAAAKSELFVDAMTNMKATLGGIGKTIGTKLIPILTPLIQRFADFWVMNKRIIGVGMDKFISGVSRAFNFLKPIVSDLFKVLKTLFGAFFEAVSSLLPEFTAGTGDVKKGINGLVGVLKFLAGAGTKAFQFITFISPFLKPFIAVLLIYKGVLIAVAIATKVWAVAQGIFNAVMSANPISLIVIGIAALIAIIVLLVKNWDTVVAAFKVGIDSTVNFFKGLWSDISSGFSIMWAFVVDLFNIGIKSIWGLFGKLLNNPFITGIVSKITNVWDKIVSVVKTAIDKIWNFFAGLLDNPFFKTAAAIMDKIFGTVTAAVEKTKDIAGGVFDKVSSGFSSLKSNVSSFLDSFFGDEKTVDLKIVSKMKLPEFGEKVIKTAIKADLKLIPKVERDESAERARPITPAERLSRVIEQNTDRSIKETFTENNSVLTIKDQTGRAELQQQKKGPQIQLETSGAA